MTPKTLTIKEACDRLDLCRSTVFKLRRGVNPVLRSLRFWGRVRLFEADVDCLLKTMRRNGR